MEAQTEKKVEPQPKEKCTKSSERGPNREKEITGRLLKYCFLITFPNMVVRLEKSRLLEMLFEL